MRDEVAQVSVKHATASAYVFGRFSAGWRLGLVKHPRLGRWMIPGGHVEDDESQAQALLREVEEESGLLVRLLEAPALPLPAGFSHQRVAPPWWIAEMAVPADGRVGEQHVHVDHQYVAVADSLKPAGGAAHPFGWYTAENLGELLMFEDTKLVAKVLFTCIDDLGEGRLSVGDVMGPFVAAAG